MFLIKKIPLISFHKPLVGMALTALVLSTFSGCSSPLKYEPRNDTKSVKLETNANKNQQTEEACASTYVVKAGDTLSGIAYQCDVEMNKIAQKNDLLPPYIIYVNQELELPIQMVSTASSSIKSDKSEARSSDSLKSKTSEQPSQKEESKEVKKTVPKIAKKELVIPNKEIKAPKKVNNQKADASKANTAKALERPAKETVYKNVKWQWPMHKGLAYKYRRDRAGLSVLEIYGVPGQEIKAVAPGKVVYAGNGIANYGWMLVIKHANDFMSIYAHNSTLLVAEGESVNAGDKVALLGATGNTKRPKLYLESRYQGRKYDIKKKLSR